MLLTITTTHRPAIDLGFLLHKHPDRCQSFDLSFGRAHVFYSESSDDRCTACLLLDIDPIGLVRGKDRFSSGLLDQYVNDRPYVASSLLSVAISQVFGSALNGRSKDRPELVAAPLPLSARIDVLPVRGGEDSLRRMFEPLGYSVTAKRHPLDEKFPEWGEGPYHSVTIEKTTTLRELLTHLYVLVPVFDQRKHYYVGEDEVEKLLAKGEGWLKFHPERETIARRYLKSRHSLARMALARLIEEEAALEEPQLDEPLADAEPEPPEKQSLNEQRLGAVLAALRASGARRVLDLGCGEGKLLRELLQDRQFEEIVGLDVSLRALEIAQRKLRLDVRSDRIHTVPPGQGDFHASGASSSATREKPERIRLLHGSLMYRDRRLEGFDAAAIVEVIEHLDPPRLAAFERVVFEHARPSTIVLTTPNREYNVLWESLPAGRFRHADHRFEWTRAEFHEWATAVAERHGYTVRFVPVGPEDPQHGPPTQTGVFRSRESRVEG